MLKDNLSRLEHVSALADYFEETKSKHSIIGPTDARFICSAVNQFIGMMCCGLIDKSIVEFNFRITKLEEIALFFREDGQNDFRVEPFDAGIIFTALRYFEKLMNEGFFDPAMEA